MTTIDLRGGTPHPGHRYSLLAVVGAGFVVAAPLATWLAVGAVTRDSDRAPMLALDVPARSPAPVMDEPLPSESADIGELDLHVLARDARLVPSFESGRLVGIKLFAIVPGSLFAQAGLQNGDVIVRVNGLDIGSEDAALAAYRSAVASRVVVVDFVRNGQRGTLTHSLPVSP